MGDRVSIQFRNKKEPFHQLSVVLFDHWGGMERVAHAKNYVKELKNEIGSAHINPLDRLEVGTVMVDYIREITKGEKRIESSLYLGATENDGDNSDNGHHIIDLE